MWTEIKAAYRSSARVAIERPLLFALPLITEFLQHVVEYRVGMFDNIAAMEATGAHPARMAFGELKVLSLLVITYWVIRQLGNMDGARLRVLGERSSLLLFLGVMVWSMLSGLPQLYGGMVLGPYLPEKALIWLGVGYFLTFTALDLYLAVWKVGAALGNRALGIRASFRIMHGNFWWSLGFFVAMFLPLMIVHYALNGLAVGKATGLLWAMLTVDAAVVGYLGIVLVATVYGMAKRAAARAGVPLTAPA